jgi:trans-aconitate methyltransferase
MTDGSGHGDGGRPDGTPNDWDPDDYERGHEFVYEYGGDVVDLLDPATGERILDLGCGTGQLTAGIAGAVGRSGRVVGIDRSAEMVARAREEHPGVDFLRADARAFTVRDRFDAVFSNAALHWITEQDAVTATVTDLLGPGGRFVAELGGTGNVETIVAATAAACEDRGYAVESPWYFPSIGEHASLLETHGFEVRHARLFDRPTELDGPDGLREWLGMFGDSLLAAVPPADREAVVADVEDRLRDELYDDATETWTADYRRLRFVAVLPDDA